MVVESLQKLPGFRVPDPTLFPTIILVGANGTGKTYLAASATKVSELCPVLLITVGKSDHTLSEKPDIDLSQLTVLDPIQHMRKVGLSNPWDAIHQVIRGVTRLKPFPFRTTILDGLTQMQFHAEKRAAEQTPFHEGESVLLELTQQGDYRLARERLLDELLQLEELCERNRVAWILTGQERLLRVATEGEVQVDERGQEVRTYRSTIDLMPSLIQPVLGMAGIVGRMRYAGGRFIMETRRSQYLDAKDTTGYLGDRVENPTMAKIVERLRKKEGGKVTGPRVSSDGKEAREERNTTE